MSDRAQPNSTAVSPAARWFFVALVALLFLAPLLFWRDLYDSLGTPKRVFIQFSAFLLLGWSCWRTTTWRLPQPLTLEVGLFLLWALASLAWSVDASLGWWTWREWTASAVIGWVVLQADLNARQVRGLLWAMAASGTVVALLGLTQAWFGWSWIPQAIPPAATLANRNMAAQVIVLTLPLAATLVYLAQKRSEFVLASFALIATSTFLFHTFTKSCWLGLSIAGVVVLSLAWRSGWRPRVASPRFLMLIVAVGVSVVAINFTAKGWRFRLPEIVSYLTGLADEPETNTSEADRLQARSSRSVSIRTTFWRNTLVIVRENPVLGAGLNNWRVVYPDATLRGVPDPTLRLNLVPDRTHNDLLQIWSELGTVGLGLALAIAVLFWREARRSWLAARERDERLILLGALAALTAIAVDALCNFPLDREIPPLYAAVLMALILRPVARQTVVVAQQCQRIGLIAFAAALALGWWHVRQWQAELYFKQQLEALRRKEWQAVVDYGEKSQALDATRVDSLRYSGRAWDQLGKPDEAWPLLMAAHLRAPNDTQLLYYLATCSQKRGQVRFAEELLQRGAAILPTEALYPHQLGLLYLGENEPTKAVVQLQTAAKLDSKDGIVQFNLGLAYEQAGLKEEAMKSYQRAAELLPKWDRPHVQLGVILKAQGQEEAAKKHWEKAKELNPQVVLPESVIK